MQFINYFFASVVSFAGLLIGIALVKIAPEEQKLLEKNFSFLRKLFLLLIFIFLIFYYFNKWHYMFLLSFFLIFIVVVEFKSKNLAWKSILTYTIFGVLFFFSRTNINLFVIESSLILLYGIPAASLMYKRTEKNYLQLIFYNINFILIANILFLVLPLLISYF